jgi:MFS family permease
MNIPLLIAIIVLFYFDTPVTAFIFLGLVGISNGFANILGSSTWAELYGTKHLGSIKALTTALMVFATAFGTALFGFLIDIGFSVSGITIVSGVYIFVSLIMLLLIRKKLNPLII